MRIYVIEMDCKEYQELKELQELKGLQKCTACNGTGKKQKIKPNPNKRDESVICYVYDCPACKGTGLVKKQKEK